MAGRAWLDTALGIDRRSMTATQRFCRAKAALEAAQAAQAAHAQAESNLIAARRLYEEESRAFMQEFFGEAAVEVRRDRIKGVVNE